MNKKVIAGLLLLAAAGICFVPIKQQKTIRIQTSYFIAYPQFDKPENWAKWQPDLAAALKKDSTGLKTITEGAVSIGHMPEGQISIQHINSFSFEVKKLKNGKSSSYSFLALPDPKSGSTLITITQRLTLIPLLFGSFGTTPAGVDLLHLKKYLENARLYYGFDIRKGMVTDSNVVVEKKTVYVKSKASEIAGVEKELTTFISQNHLRIVQPIIADIRPSSQDSLRLMIGFAVNRQIIANGKIKFMHLPPHGRMLTGIYNGKYHGREKLYLAMRSYITDHNLATPEDPYEKYLDNKIPASDTSYVHLQVNFPIY